MPSSLRFSLLIPLLLMGSLALLVACTQQEQQQPKTQATAPAATTPVTKASPAAGERKEVPPVAVAPSPGTSPAPVPKALDTKVAPSPVAGEERPAGAVTLDDIRDNPERYAGQSVTVFGEIDDIDEGQNPRVFTIEDDDDLIFNEDLLIVAAQPITVPRELTGTVSLENYGALVTGQVQRFNLVAINQALGLDLAAIYAPFEGEPVLIARQVTLLTPVEAIVRNPQAFQGRPVTVRAPVEDDRQLGPNSFVVEDTDPFTDEELVVVAKGQPVNLPRREAVDARVLITGTIRTFALAEVEREAGVDLQDELFVEFENQPVLVAEKVEILPLRERPRPGASPAASPAVSPAAAGGPVTEIPFGQPERLMTLAGRPVELTNVRVQAVPTDRLFWIGPSENQRVPVFLNEEAQTQKTQIEGKVDVNPGQTVNITGELRRVPSAEQLQQQFGVPPQEAQTVTGEPVYIFARTVQIVSR